MNNTQHTYFGNGDPNEQQEFYLLGNDVGIHHYLDLDTRELYMSMVTPNFEHAGWARLLVDLPPFGDLE